MSHIIAYIGLVMAGMHLMSGMSANIYDLFTTERLLTSTDVRAIKQYAPCQLIAPYYSTPYSCVRAHTAIQRRIKAMKWYQCLNGLGSAGNLDT